MKSAEDSGAAAEMSARVAMAWLDADLVTADCADVAAANRLAPGEFVEVPIPAD